MAEAFQLVTDSVTTLAVVAGIIIAGMGLQTWRRELHGKAEYELARKVLLGVYRIRDAVDQFRAPLISGWEMVPDGEHIVPGAGPPANSHGIALARRWSRVADTYSQLQVDLLEAEVLWGESLKNLRNNLADRLSELRNAADLLVELEQAGDGNDNRSGKVELRRTVFRIVDQDAFGPKFLSVVGAFEAELRSQISR